VAENLKIVALQKIGSEKIVSIFFWQEATGKKKSKKLPERQNIFGRRISLPNRRPCRLFSDILHSIYPCYKKKRLPL
jgi:hypothetical protein